MTDPQNRTIENTYLTEPEDNERFNESTTFLIIVFSRFFPSKVRAVVEKVFNEKLKNKVFDKIEGHEFVRELTLEIRARVNKECKMPRYKTVIQVVYGPLEQQSIRISSKCLWDTAYDNYTSYSFQNESVYCVAMVFGCYYE